MKRVTFNASEELIKRIEEKAEKRGISRAEKIRSDLNEEYFDG